MRDMLSSPSGAPRELYIGKVSGAVLQLVGREGICSFKAVSDGEDSDLLRIDLSPAVVVGPIDALADAVPIGDTAIGDEPLPERLDRRLDSAISTWASKWRIGREARKSSAPSLTFSTPESVSR
ncbi:MAG: hypothetical protein K0V04_08405 [Deltaproteobacteria bacterium]|nr:hypothetical protein [Deltaproteobacteria bacterium]